MKYLTLLLIPGGFVIGLVLFVRWKLRKRTAAYGLQYANERIALNKATYRFEGFDPSLRERSEQRRRAADAIKARAARMESGAQMSDVLRRVV